MSIAIMVECGLAGSFTVIRDMCALANKTSCNVVGEVLNRRVEVTPSTNPHEFYRKWYTEKEIENEGTVRKRVKDSSQEGA